MRGLVGGLRHSNCRNRSQRHINWLLGMWLRASDPLWMDSSRPTPCLFIPALDTANLPIPAEKEIMPYCSFSRTSNPKPAHKLCSNWLTLTHPAFAYSARTFPKYLDAKSAGCEPQCSVQTGRGSGGSFFSHLPPLCASPFNSFEKPLAFGLHTSTGLFAMKARTCCLRDTCNRLKDKDTPMLI